MKEEFVDTEGVIRIRKSKDRWYNGQKKKTNNDLQNITQKTKDRVTQNKAFSERYAIQWSIFWTTSHKNKEL